VLPLERKSLLSANPHARVAKLCKAGDVVRRGGVKIVKIPFFLGGDADADGKRVAVSEPRVWVAALTDCHRPFAAVFLLE
jgi:hypothetical protein